MEMNDQSGVIIVQELILLFKFYGWMM